MLPSLLSKVSRLTKERIGSVLTLNSTYSTMVEGQASKGFATKPKTFSLLEGQAHNQAMHQKPDQTDGGFRKHKIGDSVSRKDKMKFLVNTLLDIKDSKEAVYGALDAWVAWEQKFPIASVKQVLLALEKEQQWHRIVQVIKWMLSKGQGTTMGTYGQLIRALDMDHRAEEAHMIWQKKIGGDLHSVPWQLCRQMIGIYYRNNMLDSLVKLFKGLESFDRKPPEKSIVQRVADAYEMLGLVEEKEKLLEKYNDLFTQEAGKGKKKFRNSSVKERKKSGKLTSEAGNDACVAHLEESTSGARNDACVAHLEQSTSGAGTDAGDGEG